VSFTKEEADCETDFDRWIYVLKNMETLKRLPFKARKAVFQKLEKIVDIASLSKEEREKYDESIVALPSLLRHIARNARENAFYVQEITGDLSKLPCTEYQDDYLPVFRKEMLSLQGKNTNLCHALSTHLPTPDLNGFSGRKSAKIC
jgi:hypothetical protein